MRRFRHLLMIVLLFAVACSQQPLPTLIPTASPEPTEPPTATPLPTPSPLPSVTELTRASDPSQQAYVRVIHAAPDVPTIDIYIERLAVGANMDFGATTEPTGIVAGDYFLRVLPRGARPDSGEELLETEITLAPGDHTMLIFTGTLDALEMTAYPESNAPLDRGQSRVNFINAIAGSSDFTVTANTTLNLPAGERSAPLLIAAGDTALTFQSVATQPFEYPISLQERTDYTLILAGSADNPTIIQIQTSVPGIASLRVINAAEALGEIDVYIDGQPLATQLPYTRAGERQNFPANSYTVSIYHAGDDQNQAEPLYTTSVIANNDDVLSVLVTGQSPDIRVVPYREDLSPTPPDTARVAFVNPKSDVSRVRVDTQVGPLEAVSDLIYGQEPVTADLPLVNYTFFWNAVEDGGVTTQLESDSNIQFEAGISYLYLFTGRGNDQALIFSERVGIEAPATTADANTDTQSETIQETPTTIRFINAVNGSVALDLYLDDTLVVSAIESTLGSDLTGVGTGPFIIQVAASSTADFVASLDATLEPSTPYTVIAYGESLEDIALAIVTDSGRPQGSAAQVRLFNGATADMTQLGLAYSPAAEPGTDRIGTPPDASNFRRSVAFGMERIIPITDISAGTASAFGIVPAGITSVHILDTTDDPDSVASTISGVELEPGRLYDVVAYQESDSPRVNAFILAYPDTSG
ncbi:MAG: DUF4397 domain-containing protein [Anaerolineae bacterium]|nr:DUF4397 domain-containing protein [Anaerolineae bacterium]